MTRIIVLDTETTGKDVAKDQIVEICVQFGLEANAETLTTRIKPSVPIHPEAEKVHGITAAAVETCLPFSQAAPLFLPSLRSADVLVGFNIAFDLDILQAELERAGLPRLDLTGKHVVDALRLWHTVEPRTLVAAHEKFCGAQLADAHAASADVAATGRVLAAMLDRFGLAGKPWPELAAMANPFEKRSSWVGPSHHIQWEGAAPVITIGKHKGTPMWDVDPTYLEWLLRSDFPPHVKEIARASLGKSIDDFMKWLAEKFPRQTAQQEAA